MKQTGKNTLAWWGFLAAKVVTVIVTATDTWRASQAAGYTPALSLLHVAVLDIAFFAFWWSASEGGESEDAAQERPVNLLFAICLYLFMLGIGWEGSGVLALGVRAVGIVSLGRDGVRVFRVWWDKQTEQREMRLLDTANQYKRIMARRQKWAQWWTGYKLQSHINTAVFEQMRDDLMSSVRVQRKGVPPRVDVTPKAVQVTSPKLSSVQRREQIQDTLDANPDLTPTELHQMYGVSRTTIYKDLKTLGVTNGE